MALQLTSEWDKTFPKNENVNHKKVTFHDHFGIEIAADMYMPKNADGKLAAIAVCGPYGAVKEQVSGRYAQELASRGFLTIAFDPAFYGESGGEPRKMNSIDHCVEDFQAAVDYLSNLEEVHSEKIGIIGICGWGGYALQVASLDTRIKAIITSTMYDMSRVTSYGYNDTNDEDARYEARVNYNRMRTEEYKTGKYSTTGGQPHPDTLPGDTPEFLMSYAKYYGDRAYHERSLGSTTGFTNSSLSSLMNTTMLTYSKEIRQPVLMIHGEKAHSRYFSEDAYKHMTEGSRWAGNKELMIIPDAVHCDLYDNLDKIPFDRMESFFKENLNQK